MPQPTTKSRGGAIEAFVVTLGLTLAFVVTGMLASDGGELTGSRVTTVFIIAVIMVPFFSALIGLRVAKAVGAPGRPGLWALLCVVLPFAGIVLTAVLGAALGRPYSRRPSTS
jgi:hypothetical protein